LKEIYYLGARRIGVFSAAPIGYLPSQRTLGGGLFRKINEEYNEAAKLFNSKLSKQMDYLQSTLPNSRVVYIDIYSPLLDIILKPQKYGN
jgi:phospholipase/lecithinase/hemolysin